MHVTETASARLRSYRVDHALTGEARESLPGRALLVVEKVPGHWWLLIEDCAPMELGWSEAEARAALLHLVNPQLPRTTPSIRIDIVQVGDGVAVYARPVGNEDREGALLDEHPAMQRRLIG